MSGLPELGPPNWNLVLKIVKNEEQLVLEIGFLFDIC